MSELIDRQALLEKIKQREVGFMQSELNPPSVVCEVFERTKADICELVDHAPTIEAVPVVHGEWIGERLPASNGGTYGIRRCSRCKAYCLETAYDWEYCPNCGARMDGGKDERP